MLRGSVVRLRPVFESDLETLHAEMLNVEARGPWFPLPRTSLTKLRRSFDESGFWSPDNGIFLMVDHEDDPVGFINWERLNSDVPDVEIGYRVFVPSEMGKGITTEALRLLAGYLFDMDLATNRLRLTIHVDNTASRRVAEKCGFTNETTSREGWYHKGTWHDVHVFILTRTEWTSRTRET